MGEAENTKEREETVRLLIRSCAVTLEKLEKEESLWHHEIYCLIRQVMPEEFRDYHVDLLFCLCGFNISLVAHILSDARWVDKAQAQRNRIAYENYGNEKLKTAAKELLREEREKEEKDKKKGSRIVQPR